MSKEGLFQVTLPQFESQHMPLKSAARLMIQNVPVVTTEADCGHVIHLLKTRKDRFETINYIYVVSHNLKLMGVVSIKEIFRRADVTPITHMMKKELVTVHPYTNQEKVAFLALKNNIKSIPILDQEDRLLGVVTSDQILATTYDELRNDLFQLAGVRQAQHISDNVLHLPIGRSLRHRLPWLLVGLVGGFVVAKTVSIFELTLEQNIILASFIPLIMYMGGASSSQLTAYLIRDQVIHPDFKFRNYFYRHLLIISLIALILAALFFVGSFVVYGNIAIAYTVAVALAATIIVSAFSGLVVPYFLGRFKVDPANIDGPLVTLVQDFLGIIIYFSVAASFL